MSKIRLYSEVGYVYTFPVAPGFWCVVHIQALQVGVQLIEVVDLVVDFDNGIVIDGDGHQFKCLWLRGTCEQYLAGHAIQGGGKAM